MEKEKKVKVTWMTPLFLKVLKMFFKKSAPVK
jgi:hypothetical protein